MIINNKIWISNYGRFFPFKLIGWLKISFKLKNKFLILIIKNIFIFFTFLFILILAGISLIFNLIFIFLISIRRIFLFGLQMRILGLKCRRTLLLDIFFCLTILLIFIRNTLFLRILFFIWKWFASRVFFFYFRKIFRYGYSFLDL
jgi:hypothetical protein